MSEPNGGGRLAAGRTADPASLSGLDGVVAAALALAPEALARRQLLPAIDWSRVAPEAVAAMLAALEARGKRVPAWLARALMLAGHGVPETSAAALSQELALLNRLLGDPAGLTPTDADALRRLEAPDADVLRAIVARLTASGSITEACSIALAHWHGAPQVLQPVRQALPQHVATLPKVRLHVAALSTSEMFGEDLRLGCAAAGLSAEIGHAAFGDVIGTLLAPPADVDGTVLLLDAMRLIERDWRQASQDSIEAVRAWAETLAGAIGAYGGQSSAPLLLTTLPAPAIPTAGWRDREHALGLRRAIDVVNDRLIALARDHANLQLVDADMALADLAPARRFDARLWYYGRVAWSAEASRALAWACAQALAALRRGPAKVLALDFDNTLWGGVFGDDGVERLQCGEEAPGSAFQALQRECLRLKRQGVILVGLSKNNADAIEVLDTHPGMLLRRSDLTATAVNWEPKPGNLARLAEELRLGLDSFVFLDDSPHEREAMRRMLPQVIVPEMPADPALRPEWLRRLAVTWPVRLTAEDETRAGSYAAEAAARSLKASAATMADYLAGLEQRLDIAPVSGATLARAAQMHQRTNQFNLTTRRLGEGDIAALIADRAAGLALIGRVRDKFGDHGITIAATATIDGTTAEITTLLMSCRVIGREIERAFLGALLRELAGRGVERVRGRYIPTAKNAMVRDFYGAHGFQRADGEGDTWEFQLGNGGVPSSAYVTTTMES